MPGPPNLGPPARCAGARRHRLERATPRTAGPPWRCRCAGVGWQAIGWSAIGWSGGRAATDCHQIEAGHRMGCHRMGADHGMVCLGVRCRCRAVSDCVGTRSGPGPARLISGPARPISGPARLIYGPARPTSDHQALLLAQLRRSLPGARRIAGGLNSEPRAPSASRRVGPEAVIPPARCRFARSSARMRVSSERRVRLRSNGSAFGPVSRRFPRSSPGSCLVQV